MSIVIDRRSIADVQPGDLHGFTRCHFFAGIAGWELALNLAGWPADREVWTGSCPCQPYSAAGKNKGDADERNLWPDFFRLIRECRPDTIFGEQVENAIGHGWLDGVFGDLEREGYTCGATVLGAHSVGSPNIRQRLFWVAYASKPKCGWWREPGGQHGRALHAPNGGGVDGLANAASLPGPEHEREPGSEIRGITGPNNSAERGRVGGLAITHVAQFSGVAPTGELPVRKQGAGVDGLEHAAGDGRDERRAQSDGRSVASGCGDDRLANSKSQRRSICDATNERPSYREINTPPDSGIVQPWSDFAVIYCRDEKYRRVESVFFTVADGLPNSLGLVQPELVEFLENKVLEHAKNCERSSDETMRDLREHITAETFQRGVRGFYSLRSPQVLLSFLCQLSLQGWRFKHAMACSRAGIQGRILRGMWIGNAAACASRELQLERQSQGKHTNVMRELSSLLARAASCGWAHAYDANAKWISPLTNSVPRSGSNRTERKILAGARGNRVGRLKGYGNAINPYVAAEFIAAFLECEKEDSHGG